MNFTNLITKIDSFNKPVEKLTEVKQNKLVPNETKIDDIRKLSGLNESVDRSIEECGGMMPPMSRPETPVTMNVSVNATGKDSIRDLLDILKGAELDGADQAVGGPAGIVLGLGGDREDDVEIDEAGLGAAAASLGRWAGSADPKSGWAKPASDPKKDASAASLGRWPGSADPSSGWDKPASDGNELDEAGEDGGFKDASTEPDEQYADQDDAYPTGNDLSSKGDNEVEKVNGGGNPYASLSEQLKQNLHTLYKEVKSR